MKLAWSTLRPRLFAAGASVGAVLFATLFALTTLYDRLDGWAYDSHQRLLGRDVPLDGIVLFDLDEATLAEPPRTHGALPYDRDTFAAAMQYLTRHGARAVGFDLLFAEGREDSGALAATLARTTVLGASGVGVPVPLPQTYRQQLERVAIARHPGEHSGDGSADAAHADETLPHYDWPAMRLPDPQLTAGSRARVGVVSVAVDDDGSLRRLALFHASQGYILPSFPVAMMMAADPTLAPRRSDTSRVVLGRHVIPVTPSGEALVRYPANADELRVIPFSELVAAAGGAPGSEWVARDVAGRAVFIGSSSALAGNRMQTPVGRLPELHLMALTYAALWNGQVLKPPSPVLDAAMLLLALLPALWLIYHSAEASARDYTVAFAGVIVAFVLAGTILFAVGYQSRWLFALVTGLIALGAAVFGWLFQLSEERRRLRYEALAAREATRLKTEFLNHLTHELRTPLTAIIGFNKINQFTEDLGREARIKNSAIIGRNCEHLLTLINNNLDLAKLEAGTLVVAPAPEDAEQLFRDVLATMAPFAEEKRIRLKFTKQNSLPPALMLDRPRVRQIVINLLSNAIKFTQAGSVELVVAWHLAALSIEVRDTGPGIPREALDRIFRPFEQADPSVGQRFGGTGLGLAITRSLVSLMGGTIEVESVPGRGSTFRVRIPSEPADRPDKVRPITEAVAVREPLAGTVLLAEDNDDIRVLVEHYLARLGADVRSVANGLSAVEAALLDRYDVILMDMEMPIMNGYEAVHVLRTRGYTGTILALTAHQEGLEAERALAAGCDGLVRKPVTLDALREALRPILRETRPAASARRDAGGDR